MSIAQSPRSALFHATNWSLIGCLHSESLTERREALGTLLTDYLPALKSHLVAHRRMTPDDADDLLNDFVVKSLEEATIFQAVDRARGRFRKYLVMVIDNYWRDRHRRATAKMRAPSGFENWDEVGEQLAESPANNTIEADRTWACLVLRETLEVMWELSQTTNGRRNWNTFCYQLLVPLFFGLPKVEYDDIVEREGFKDRDQAQNSLVSAKRLFHRTLRSVIAKYSSNEEEIENDISDLMCALTGYLVLPTAILTPDLLAALPTIAQLSIADGSSQCDLSRVFLIEDHPFGDWDQRESAEILAQALAMPLARLLPVAAHAGIPAEQLRQSPDALFQDARPNLAALIACKQFGKSWIENRKAALPTEIGAYFYFISIAIAASKLNESISSSDMTVIQRGIARLVKSYNNNDEIMCRIRCVSIIDGI